MAVSPFKTFSAGEVLTASDLNASFSQVFDNGEDLAYPATQARDYNGFELILDADGDSSITSDTDDQIDFKLGGTDYFIFKAGATTNVLDINGSVTTTGAIVDISDADALTTGGILNLVSNSADVSTRSLVTIHNNNSAAAGTTVLTVIQDAEEPAISITQTANQISLDITSSATTNNVIDIAAASVTAGIVVDIPTADALTTGTILNLISNSADTSLRYLVDVQNNNSLATSAIPLRVVQDSTGNAVFVDHNGNGRALNIDSQATTSDVVYIEADQVTTGSVINIPDADALTTGSILNLVSNSLDGTARNLVFIHNNSSSAGDTTCLALDQDANEAALTVVSDSTTSAVVSVVASTTTGTVLDLVADSLTTGEAASMASNSPSSGTRNICHIHNQNTNATGSTCLRLENEANAVVLRVNQDNASFTSIASLIDTVKAANSDFQFFAMRSNNAADTEFNFRGDGEAFADGSFTGGGADLADFYEWADGNPNGEDRRGVSVVLEGKYIREATAEDPPHKIIGAISANPSIVGDSAWNKWYGKYLRDDFGSYVMEDYEVWSWVEYKENGEFVKSHSYAFDNIPDDVIIPDDKEVTYHQRRKLNPDFDPGVSYTPRAERKEWDWVGRVGKLRIRKGQITHPDWVWMQEISDTVDEWTI